MGISDMSEEDVILVAVLCGLSIIAVLLLCLFFVLLYIKRKKLNKQKKADHMTGHVASAPIKPALKGGLPQPEVSVGVGGGRSVAVMQPCTLERTNTGTPTYQYTTQILSPGSQAPPGGMEVQTAKGSMYKLTSTKDADDFGWVKL